MFWRSFSYIISQANKPLYLEKFVQTMSIFHQCVIEIKWIVPNQIPPTNKKDRGTMTVSTLAEDLVPILPSVLSSSIYCALTSKVIVFAPHLGQSETSNAIS